MMARRKEIGMLYVKMKLNYKAPSLHLLYHPYNCLAISHLVRTNVHRNHFSPLVGASFLVL